MVIYAPISLGELVDKVTILRIKLCFIGSKAKILNIQKEEKLLSDKLEALNLVGVDDYLKELHSINLELWKIEDDIRAKEMKKEFDELFIELARKVYITNDRRFKIKNSINSKYNSGLTEEKSYKDYE